MTIATRAGNWRFSLDPLGASSATCRIKVAQAGVHPPPPPPHYDNPARGDTICSQPSMTRHARALAKLELLGIDFDRFAQSPPLHRDQRMDREFAGTNAR